MVAPPPPTPSEFGEEAERMAAAALACPPRRAYPEEVELAEDGATDGCG